MEITYNTNDKENLPINTSLIIKDILYKLKELDKELQKERKVKKDILKAWKEDIEKYEEWLKRERKEKESIVNWNKKH